MKISYDDKILIAGAGQYYMYDIALCEAFHDNGYYNTFLFSWNDYFSDNTLGDRLVKKIEVKFACGIKARKFNNELISKCISGNVKILFIYTCRLLFPSTIKRISEMGIITISYCNDNPFSNYYPWYFWKNYRDSLKYCTINYAYRWENVYDIEKKCGRQGKLLRSYYIESRNHLCNEEDIIDNIPEVVFLGHYEDDYRMEYLRTLVSEGVTVGLPKRVFEKYVSEMSNVVLLDEESIKYNEYICSCKIPITFLSTLNHDTYTRRCFEIPAAGALLFCPYTEDLATMFIENEEIVFFRNKQEFVEKIKYYLNHEDERKRIAQAGRKRLIHDGHEVKNRVRQIVNDIEELD